MNPRQPEWLSFDCEGIRFDNTEAGVGATTAVTHVDRYGFVVMMRPSVFLSLTPAFTPECNPDKLVNFVRSGGRIGSPFLSVDPEAERLRVRTHEGRHRMRAILALAGNTEIPVAMLLDSGYRAREISEEHVDRVRAGAWSEGKGGPSEWIEGPLFGTAWLNGYELEPPLRPAFTA